MEEQDLHAAVEGLLKGNPYAPFGALQLEILKAQVRRGAARNPAYANYVAHWPTPLDTAQRLEDLPYLPVTVFKRDPPISLCDQDALVRVARSSATTGQVPSSIALDATTARYMTRGANVIFQDVLGKARRPYLVIDCPESNQAGAGISARGAAIRSLQAFANGTTYALTGDLTPDYDALAAFQHRHGDEPVLVYGFTWILWDRFARPLRDRGFRLTLPQATVLHSGGWKKLQAEAVAADHFRAALADGVGCPDHRVIDFYGMIENLGIVYPDCSTGLKHAPSFGGVIVRDPVTLAPAAPGQTGLLQVCSLLPTSFPGWLLLTEDMAELVHDGDCPCGRPGPAFRLKGRAPKAEIRGCGDVLARRLAVAP